MNNCKDVQCIFRDAHKLYPIPAGFTDSSYHNDITASFTSGPVTIWIYDDATQKDYLRQIAVEGEEAPRFMVIHDDGWYSDVQKFDDWDQARLAAIELDEKGRQYPKKA